MASSLWRSRELSRVRLELAALLAFVVLLGVINLLLVNQRVVLQVFYIPVVFAAWRLPKRHAVSVATLGALLVLAYAVYVPGKLVIPGGSMLAWVDLGIWGGILVVTAYLVSVLRARTDEAVRNLQRAYMGVLSILSKFIETVDADTEAHSVRVSAWSVHIAKEMRIGQTELEETRIAALLHDVGKVDVSVEILRKAASLSDQEQAEVRQHAQRGSDMVKPVGGMLTHIAENIESHHERFDGSGYKGLKGEEIPLPSRIIAVADALDAMLSDRPYRKGVGILAALDTILMASGKYFDPKVVAAFKRIVDREGDAAVAETSHEAHLSPTSTLP
jgi:hypothetical protein